MRHENVCHTIKLQHSFSTQQGLDLFSPWRCQTKGEQAAAKWTHIHTIRRLFAILYFAKGVQTHAIRLPFKGNTLWFSILFHFSIWKYKAESLKKVYKVWKKFKGSLNIQKFMFSTLTKCHLDDLECKSISCDKLGSDGIATLFVFCNFSVYQYWNKINLALFIEWMHFSSYKKISRMLNYLQPMTALYYVYINLFHALFNIHPTIYIFKRVPNVYFSSVVAS